MKDASDADDIGLRFIDSGGTTRDIRNTSVTNYNDAAWHHVAATYSNSGDVGKLYLDGTEVASVAIAGDISIRTTGDNLTIGAGLGDAGRHFNGKVDEVRIYSRALSADEVTALGDYAEFELTLSPDGVMNEVGSEHTVIATLNPALSNTPVLFEVSGANEGEEGVASSDDNGEAEFTYVGENTGLDTITACIDLNNDGDCGEGESSATADKTWFARYFVTGGGNIKDESGKKNLWSFGGNVGLDDEGNAMGQFQINDHANRDTCHFDTFPALTFDGVSTDSPEVDVKEATFTAEGECQKAGSVSIEVVMTDNAEPGSGADEISVSSGDGGPVFSGIIDGGNFQVHPPTAPEL